ncbi:hypothetical protein, partial [Pseudonocardia lacus]|uniref:hypothetical protein n=1 Tax=Pseudonocardia lacus TaxID=2835865 RepID=UPI001BDDB5D6
AGRRPGDGGVSRPAGEPPVPGQATTAMQGRGADAVSATTMLPAQKLPVEPTEDRSAGITRFLSPVFALVAVALLPVAAATTDLYALDGWGLARVLGPAAWGAILCAVAACVSELWARRPRIPMLATATGVLILCTNGLPSVIEPAARFGTAWTTVGFVDAIAAENGVSPVGLDARFYWPAFFAQWAWFREAGGADNLDTVLRWFPPVVVTITAIGIYAMGRSMLGGTRAPWVAAWLFVGLNWIEQDYFSPQAQAVVLLLTVLTFALGPLATRRIDAAGVPGWPAPHPGAPRLPLTRRWLVAAMTPPNRPALPPRQLLFIYFCMILCVIAVVVEHQLTPIALIGQLTLLAVVGRFRGRAVLVVGIMAVALWIFVNNRDFWTAQLGILIGSGDTGAALQAGVADRLAGDAGQVFVKQLRIVLAGFTYLLGAVGMLVYWRRRRDLVPFGLAVVPMALAAQGYGSEGFLRIVLYGLPILVILGTDALRWLARRWRPSEFLLAAAMIVMFGTLVLVRGGNESYQATFPEEVAMYRQVVAETPPDLEIVSFNQAGPTGLEGITIYGRGDNIEGCGQLADDPLVCADKQDADVLVNYTSGEKYGVYLENRPPGWSLEIVQQLVSSGRYVLTYQDGYNVVLKKAIPADDGDDQQGGDQGGGDQGGDQGADQQGGQGAGAGQPAGAGAGGQPAGGPAGG